MKLANTIKRRFVVIDTITNNEVSEYFRFEDEAVESIQTIEENDKEAGCFEPNSYKVESIEII